MYMTCHFSTLMLMLPHANNAQSSHTLTGKNSSSMKPRMVLFPSIQREGLVSYRSNFGEIFLVRGIGFFDRPSAADDVGVIIQAMS